MVTASGPVWVMDCRVGLMTTPVSTDFECASKLASSAAPLQGVASWNTTLGFKVTVQLV